MSSPRGAGYPGTERPSLFRRAVDKVEHPTMTELELEVIRQHAAALRNFTNASSYADPWKAQTVTLSPGHGQRIATANAQRKRLTIFTDGNNTAPIFISPGQLENVPTGANSGAIGLGADSDPFVLRATGDVYAITAAAGSVYVVEEYAR